LKENVSVFLYYITSTRAQKAKLTVNFLAFPSVKFRQTWQAVSNCFSLVGARFSGKSTNQFFCSGKTHSFAKIGKPAFTSPTFFVFKIRISQDLMCSENFGRFHLEDYHK